ncbi:hypothetical protein RhiJN_03966 [Ceratobasidium sp. AG-Ba]|nr:hypothetical protein RhiJN_03966 [Ceratobasidium sp. AG-Ba]
MDDLKLNSTQLFFVPGPTESDVPSVVQVTLQSEVQPVSFELLSAYHLAQPNLTKLILLVLAHHRTKRLPSPATFVGDGFSLDATHRPWTYGKQWDFKWGDESILASDDKWTFVFRAR